MSAAGFDVREDDLESAATRALWELHLLGMHASSPPGIVYALDLSGLRIPKATVWTAWRDERVASVGALKTLGSDAAEVIRAAEGAEAWCVFDNTASGAAAADGLRRQRLAARGPQRSRPAVRNARTIVLPTSRAGGAAAGVTLTTSGRTGSAACARRGAAILHDRAISWLEETPASQPLRSRRAADVEARCCIAGWAGAKQQDVAGKKA